jgi:hypothetical protein
MLKVLFDRGTGLPLADAEGLIARVERHTERATMSVLSVPGV